MNLAKSYLEEAYPDSLFTRDHVEKLEAAGMLGWAKARLRQLEAEGESFAAPGASPVDAALALEAQQMAQFNAWREQLAMRMNDPRLQKVPLVFADLTTPQAVTVHQIDNSDAIALDRRMTGFLGALTGWAYIALLLEQRGVEALDATSLFMLALSDHLLLNYSKLPVSADFEMRELQMHGWLNETDRSLIHLVSQSAAKFVLYHELGHVHLNHFETGNASSVSAGPGEVSAFESVGMEFQADAFANEHLIDPDGTITAAIVGRVAPRIYCLLLAMKEAMLPGTGDLVEIMARDHPPSAARAAKLRAVNLPPAYVPQWAILFAVPELLESLYQSKGFREAASMFASAITASQA